MFRDVPSLTCSPSLRLALNEGVEFQGNKQSQHIHWISRHLDVIDILIIVAGQTLHISAVAETIGNRQFSGAE